MTSIPEGMSNTRTDIQQDTQLFYARSEITTQARALQESLLLNPDLNASNTSVGRDQFKHSLNLTSLEPPRSLINSDIPISKLGEMIDAQVDKEISALPEPLQSMMRKSVLADRAGNSLEGLFAEAGTRAEGYKALEKEYQQLAMQPDKIVQLREMIYFFAMIKVGNTLPPSPTSAVKAASYEIGVLPVVNGALRALESTQKGALALIKSAPAYGDYLNDVMGALHSAMATLQFIQVSDAKVDKQFAVGLQTLAAEALKKAEANIAKKAEARVAEAERKAEAEKQKWINIGILIGAILLSVVSIVATVYTAGAAGAAAGVAITGVSSAVQAVSAGMTVGGGVMIAVDIAAVVIATVDFATNSAITNALTQGFADLASGLGMSKEACAGLIVGLAVLMFLLTRRTSVLSKVTQKLVAEGAIKEGGKGAARLAALSEKAVGRTLAANLAIPMLMMSGVIPALAAGLAKTMFPNDPEAQGIATAILSIVFMIVTLGACMGGLTAVLKKSGYTGLEDAVIGAVKGSVKGASKAGANASGAVAGVGRAGAEAGEGAARGLAKAGGEAAEEAGAGAGRGVAGEIGEGAEGAARGAGEGEGVVDGVADAAGQADEVAPAQAAREGAPAADAAADANPAQVQGAAPPPTPQINPSAAKSAASNVDNAPKTKQTTADELALAKSKLKEIDVKIGDVQASINKSTKAIKDAEDALKLNQPPKTADEIADLQKTIKEQTELLKKQNAAKELLKNERNMKEIEVKNLETRASEETLTDKANFEKTKIRMQNGIQSLKMVALLTPAGFNIWDYFIQTKMADLALVISRLQADATEARAAQFLLQSYMDKLTSDRDSFQNSAKDIATVIEGIMSTGNTLLYSVQSGARAVLTG